MDGLLQVIGGSPFTQSSNWSDPGAVIEIVGGMVKLTLVCLLAGLPPGLAGLLRRERMRRLSVLGMFSSLSVIGYFIIAMQYIAGGPNGD